MTKFWPCVYIYIYIINLHISIGPAVQASKLKLSKIANSFPNHKSTCLIATWFDYYRSLHACQQWHTNMHSFIHFLKPQTDRLHHQLVRLLSHFACMSAVTHHYTQLYKSISLNFAQNITTVIFYQLHFSQYSRHKYMLCHISKLLHFILWLICKVLVGTFLNKM